MKRTIIRISLLMLLGVVTSVAVAWACAWWAGHIPDLKMARQDYAIKSDHEYQWQVYELRSFGFDWVSRFFLQSAGSQTEWQEDAPWWTTRDYSGEGYIRTANWGVGSRKPIINVRDEVEMGDAMLVQFNEGEAACGWPVLCLRTQADREVWKFMPESLQPDEYKWSGTAMAFVRDNGSSWNHAHPLVLPYAPIWPGLLANTSVFGGVWFAILFGPGMFIRWRRRRAGRCAKCGYDLRGAEVRDQKSEVSVVCPECGAERSANLRPEGAQECSHG